MIVLVLLMVNVYTGASSPNWSPFENPTFGSYMSTYKGYIESQDIVGTLPAGTIIYEDNDLPIQEVAALNNVSATKDRSYQTIRVVIQEFKSNEIDFSNQRVIRAMIFLRTNEITDPSLFEGPIDLVYSDGETSGLKISSLQQ